MTEAGNEFSEEAILAGELTPVFFGSALTNFGVQTFLDTFLKFAPEPHGHKTVDGDEIDPLNKDFSGFVFKIQANMDPRHRDRIAFVRIVSGEFERGMSVNLTRTGKGLSSLTSLSLWPSPVKMSKMLWLEILSGFTIQELTRLVIPLL